MSVPYTNLSLKSILWRWNNYIEINLFKYISYSHVMFLKKCHFVGKMDSNLRSVSLWLYRRWGGETRCARWRYWGRWTVTAASYWRPDRLVWRNFRRKRYGNQGTPRQWLRIWLEKQGKIILIHFGQLVYSQVKKDARLLCQITDRWRSNLLNTNYTNRKCLIFTFIFTRRSILPSLYTCCSKQI